MRLKNRIMKRILIFVLVSLLLISLVTAAVEESRLDEFLKSIADTIEKSLTETIRRVIIASMVTSKVNELRDATYTNIDESLLNDPPLTDPKIEGFINFFIFLLQPVFVFGIISVGFYLIFFSGSPRGRSKAKSMLLKLIIGMAIISLSVEIIQLMLNTSNTITSEILKQYTGDFTSMHKATIDYFQSQMTRFMLIDVAISIPFLILTVLFSIAVFAVLLLRYLLIILLAVIFPVAVFFSFFYLTESIGRILLKQLLFWIFLPVGYAIALIVIAVGGNAILALIPEISNIINISGTLLLIISPLIVFGLINWFTAFLVLPTIFIQPLKEKRIEEEEPGAVVGLRGYEAIPEKELPKEEIKPRLREMADMRGEIPVEKIQKNKRLYRSLIRGARRKGISVEEFVMKEYGFRVTGEGVKARTPYIKPVPEKRPLMRERISTSIPPRVPSKVIPQKKKKMLTVTLPPRPVSDLIVNVPPGETETVDIAIRNEGYTPLSKVIIYDEDLLSAGIYVNYSENLFRLEKGEEKVVKISINPKEDIKRKSYRGSIIVRTAEGIKSIVDVYIDTREKKKEKFRKGVVKKFMQKT